MANHTSRELYSMKRLVAFAPTQFRDLQSIAQDEGITFQDLIREVLRVYIENYKDKIAARALALQGVQTQMAARCLQAHKDINGERDGEPQQV